MATINPTASNSMLNGQLLKELIHYCNELVPYMISSEEEFFTKILERTATRSVATIPYADIQTLQALAAVLTLRKLPKLAPPVVTAESEASAALRQFGAKLHADLQAWHKQNPGLVITSLEVEITNGMRGKEYDNVRVHVEVKK